MWLKNNMYKIITVARKECTDALNNRVFIVFLAFLILLTSISLYVGAVNFHVKVALFDKTYRLLIASGQSAADLVRPEFYPLQLLRATIEYLEIIGAVLAISLGYLSIAKEKGSNTLPLIFSRPISKRNFYIGKLLGGSAMLGAVTLLVCATIMLLLSVVGNVSLSGIELYKIFLSGIATFIYLLTFFAFATLSTTLIKNSSNALIVSFVVWLLFVLIVPQIGDTMDTDNQVPGGFFNAIHINQVDSHIILKQFPVYETIRTGTEDISITKHYERLTFALLGIKDSYNGKSIFYIVNDKLVDIYWLLLAFGACTTWSLVAFTRSKLLWKRNE